MPQSGRVLGLVEWSDYKPPQWQKWFKELLENYEKTGRKIESVDPNTIPNAGKGIISPRTGRIRVEYGATQGTFAEELYHFKQFQERKILGQKSELLPPKLSKEIEDEVYWVLKSKGYKSLDDLRRGGGNY